MISKPTTIKAQRAAQSRLVQQVPMTDRHGAAISVVQPGTGNILVMAQNRLWGTERGNRYTTYNYNVERSADGVGFQTGSTFKPFTLAAAIEAGINPATTYYQSAPFNIDKGDQWGQIYGPWNVHTAEGGYHGRISLERATLASDNSV